MKVKREYARLPTRGQFRRIALRQGGWTGWTFWAEGKSRDGYSVCGMGRTAREAINDLRSEQAPTHG